MRDLAPLDGDVRRARRARPLRDSRARRLPHAPCFAGDRVEPSSSCGRPARSTRSCMPPGGGILSTVEATRAAGEDALARGGPAAPRLDARQPARRRSRGSRATGSTATRSWLSSPRSPRRAASRRGSARMPFRPSSTTRTRTWTSRSRRCCPRRRRSPRRPTSSSSAAHSTSQQARRYLEACRERRARASPARRPVHRGGRRSRSRSSSARASVDHLEATGDEGVRALAASDVAGVLLPSPRSSSAGRCRPAARSSMRARPSRSRPTSTPGARSARACRSSATLACTQLGLSPAEALAACTVNAAHVLGRADRVGRLAPGFAADLVLLDAPDWRYLAYHLGGPDVAVGGRGGEVAWTARRGIISRCRAETAAHAGEKLQRHEYEYVSWTRTASDERRAAQRARRAQDEAAGGPGSRNGELSRPRAAAWSRQPSLERCCAAGRCSRRSCSRSSTCTDADR